MITALRSCLGRELCALALVQQRCWFHKLGNILNALPKTWQPKAKADLQAIWMAPTLAEAQRACDRFVARYQAKYPKATEKLVKDRDALLAFYAFPCPSGKPA